MCGILAYFNLGGVSKERLVQSLTSLKNLKHRGPDGEGVTLINIKTGNFYNLITDETPAANFTNPINLQQACETEFHLLLGHRRLSIIDVSVNGHQPMAFKNGNWIIFNGEIYNYIEIREELKNLGYSFKTDSDTEVIHAAYDAWKEKCVQRFNGMFSILLYDSNLKIVFAANDRFGVKPLYYYKNDTSTGSAEILFVSEVNQIKPFKITTSVNEEAVSVFLKSFYLDYDDSTFYKEVKRFKPAHFSKLNLFDLSSILQERYYQVQTKINSIGETEAIEQFKKLFESAVSLRLRSDVPLGFSSSGGLDSSAVLYTAISQLKKNGIKDNVNTFSAIFPGQDGDESEFIKLVETDLKTPSHYINPMENFEMTDFEKHIYHCDFPVQSTSFYSAWCVARMVKNNNVKVLMVGQGADEILAGYHHHFYRYGRQLIMSGKIIKYISLIKKYAELKNLKVNVLHKIILNDVKLALKFKAGLSAAGSTALDNKWNKAGALIELLKLDLTETTMPFYLRADDRNGMAFSVETRHPFLDYRLVDFCFSLPDHYKIKEGWQKYILRKAMDKLPNEIRYRKDKKGYTTPQKLWIENNKNNFESYLNYLPLQFKNITASEPFLKYSLGAWFKVMTK